jgi:hypothetical protein
VAADSILDSVKPPLGLSLADSSFDLDVIMLVNSAFGALYQMNVGPVDGFSISDNNAVWSDYVTDADLRGHVEAFIVASVRLAFDPPGTSFGIDAIKSQIQKLAWLINVRAEELNPPSDPFEEAS